MAELGQETVEFSTLVSRAAEESFVSLKELVDKSRSSDMSDSEKKINLLKYIVKTQQRMLRLSVLGKWCQQVPLIQYCQQLQSTLSNHDTCFTQAADSMFFMHEGLQQARAPIYDVPSAMEILLTGTYERLPKCIEDVGILNSLGEDQQKPALKKLDTLLRSKMLEVSVPREFSEVKISDGTATLFVKGEFKVLVTLGYRGHLELWRLLHMELLVGERSGPVKLEELRRYALGEDIERRMAAAENPFMALYSVLHELCVALIMDTVIRQVQALRQGRWKDSIRFELISDGMGQGGSSGFTQTNQDGEADSVSLRTPGLKILYWLDFEKNSTPDSGCCPFIKIEPGADQQIKCVHSTFVVDPSTGKEADFYLDQSCIDVEMMLLRAICCNRYTRLFEIQKELAKNSQICRVSGDVVLQGNMDEPEVDNKKKESSISNAREYGQEVLRVRAYGSSFFTLGINIRSGRFLLQSSGNLLAPSTLLECEEALNQGSMIAAEVFFSMRSKSILHLFASIGRFLGLEVYENKLSTVKVPKNILNGSTWTLMGFPDCGSSYYLLMQLDRDFKPLFKLLETQPDSSGRPHLLGHLDNVTRIINIDIGQMQMLDDELNLSLLDSGKVLSALPNAGGFIQSSENCPISEFSREGYLPNAICTQSSFSNIIDEVFEFEKGAPEPSLSTLSVQNLISPSNSSAASHFVSVPMNPHGINNATKVPNVSPHYNGSLYSNNTKGSIRSSSISSLYSDLARSTAIKKLQATKSDQNLSSVRSPQSVELDSRSTSGKLNLPKSIESVKVAGSSLIIAPTTCQLTRTATFHTSSLDPGFKNDRNPRKRTVSDLLNLIPSLQLRESNEGFSKRRKISESASTQQLSSQTTNILSEPVCKNEGSSYGNLIAEATKGNAPSSVFVSTLLHVVRHCSLSIKHARLISQMEALDIPYVEEAGLGSASSNLWFRLPFSQGNPWPHICLRLGKPGNMYWDVKINDQHFRDLWDLQKAINSTPWGSGVRIANTSDIDSHIRFDPEGVVLSYESVEADSIKKLVADICRLSNARMFALGMRKLLGVRVDERLEESSDNKALVGTKSVVDTADKLSEQMRKTFRIEAVGLMSLWFSFGSGVLARFVVEWESEKKGCTMHVSPDQLWPHTKFLEDFINGAEVASLLDCIRLTAGPLHALAAAIRPARAGPVSGVPGLAAAISSIPKPNGYMPPQGPLPSSSHINAGQSISASGLPTTAIPVGSPNFQGAAMLAAAAGRGGPGIVPSSLLPIDVSVVLRGPYWIRIIYRKYFAVDMRCFAGDQVWLQPATPPKVGPSVGGSLPCPQFRPFIMEHVAQELNGLEPNFTGGQHTTSNNPNLSVNGTRVNIPNSNGVSRSGLPVRRSPGTVPAHVRGELNTAIIGLGDDGGYGGGWVPLVALKKVLRGILKYLGVLWLFAQLPDLLKEILGSILKDNEGALLNLDQEQPALRFFVGGYVFAVSVHRVQLLLQVLSVKRFHHQQQQQQNSASAQEELTQSEISEICDYFSRRVASEPYDASRVASFITLLTLPISVLREFLKLIAWKKGLAQTQGGDIVPTQKPRIELCLENHAGLNMDENSETSCASKSNIHYDRSHNSVDFGLTVVLDPAHIPHINAAGGAAWLPYCVSVRLRYSFGENPNISFLKMEGSHGGKACWLRSDDWEKCKQRVARTLEMNNGSSSGDVVAQGRLKMVADVVQRTLQMCLQGFRDSPGPINASSGTM